MAAPQAVLRFPGISGVVSWNYTLSHGISPGVCTVDILPTFQVPPQTGTLQIVFGDTVLSFQDCIVDAATMRRAGDGSIVGVTILDRRWRWRFGEISGRYNVREVSGVIDDKTEKTPRNLAGLLLTAMGEQSYDVFEMPNDARPQVDWAFDNPASELADLCESLGCRVVLGLDGRVSVRRMGLGGTLPSLPTQVTTDFGVDPPIRPDKLKLVAAPTRFQSMFRLEAIGEDVGGELLPIEELSYMPSNGWGAEAFYSFGNISNVSTRELAIKTIYRWWRIKCTADQTERGKFRISGLDSAKYPVRHLWQVLPLEDSQADTFFDVDGVEQSQQAFISGIYWKAGEDDEPIANIREIAVQFTIDTKRGIVMTSEPIVNKDSSDNIIEPDLYLTVAHGVKDIDTRLPVRFTLERPMVGQNLGTKPAIIHRDDLVETYISVYNTDGDTPRLEGISNDPLEIEQDANAYLDAAQAQYQTLRQGNSRYAGIVAVSPDGAIHQVQWSGGVGSPAYTHASLNSESSLIVPSQAERRQIERAKAYNAEGRKTARKLLRILRTAGGPIQ